MVNYLKKGWDDTVGAIFCKVAKLIGWGHKWEDEVFRAHAPGISDSVITKCRRCRVQKHRG